MGADVDVSGRRDFIDQVGWERMVDGSVSLDGEDEEEDCRADIDVAELEYGVLIQVSRCRALQCCWKSCALEQRTASVGGIGYIARAERASF